MVGPTIPIIRRVKQITIRRWFSTSAKCERPAGRAGGDSSSTSCGLGMAERLSCDLMPLGLVISQTVAVFGRVVYHTSRTDSEPGRALISNPMNTFAAPQNFPFAIASSAVFQSACWSSKLPIRRHPHHPRCDLEQNREVSLSRQRHQQNSWGPHPDQTGLKLTATWEDVWEELPPQVRLFPHHHR